MLDSAAEVRVRKMDARVSFQRGRLQGLQAHLQQLKPLTGWGPAPARYYLGISWDPTQMSLTGATNNF